MHAGLGVCGRPAGGNTNTRGARPSARTPPCGTSYVNRHGGLLWVGVLTLNRRTGKRATRLSGGQRTASGQRTVSASRTSMMASGMMQAQNTVGTEAWPPKLAGIAAAVGATSAGRVTPPEPLGRRGAAARVLLPRAPSLAACCSSPVRRSASDWRACWLHRPPLQRPG